MSVGRVDLSDVMRFDLASAPRLFQRIGALVLAVVVVGGVTVLPIEF